MRRDIQCGVLFHHSLSPSTIHNRTLRGKIAVLIKKYVNSDYEFPWSMFVGYLAILIGCVMTILVQSSSIFTSALTPLAGIGVISLERIYPLTLGSNIGTTTTGTSSALRDWERGHVSCFSFSAMKRLFVHVLIRSWEQVLWLLWHRIRGR